MANDLRANADTVTPEPPPLPRSLPRILMRVATVLAVAYGAHLLTDWTMDRLKALPPEESSLMLTSLLVMILAAYAFLIAIPFVPGVEIGLSLLLMQGPPLALPVYLASVAGLLIAYFTGRFLPSGWICRALLDLRLVRAARFFDEISTLTPSERLELLSDRLPGWLGPHILRWRYPLLALLINLPGTTIIGGGGGISMIAGLSRLYAPVATVVTVFLAVLPVPLGIWFFGIGLLH
jgi:hypothetical protein